MTMKPFSVLMLCVILARTHGGNLTADYQWICEYYEEDPLLQDRICDGFPQCGDDSDESEEAGQGCNLFPESGCDSVRGREHFRCNRTGDCFSTKTEALECDSSVEAPQRDCELEDGEPGFKCKNSLCISTQFICDGSTQCKDKTDESDEPYGGCNMFPDLSDGCLSIGGKEHLRCEAEPNKHICISLEIRDSPGFNKSDPASCRKCKNSTEWRCDDGRCIAGVLHRDGKPDCLDGSDEIPFTIYWYYILTATVVIVITGICASLLINWASKKRHSSDPEPEDIVDGPLDGSAHSDIPTWIQLIQIFEDKASWAAETEEDCSSPKILKADIVRKARKKYILMYTDPIQYHNLYMYFAHRYATLTELNTVVKYLMDWEGDIHGENKVEIKKSWRLHLGVSDMTGRILDSVADKMSLDDKLDEAVYPARNVIRKCRRKILELKPNEDGKLYRAVSTACFSLVPILEGSFFYFERFKNIIYIHIFSTALQDLSKDNFWKFPFESSLVIFMSISVGLVQLINIFLSAYYAEDVLEAGQEKNRKLSARKMGLKLLAVVLSPFFPIIVLANHVYYESHASRLRRHLQDEDEDVTFQKGDVNGSPAKTPEENIDRRVDRRVQLYKKISEAQRFSLLYRQIYSYFRVVSAVLESCTTMVCLLLLLFVTGRAGREINLISGVENKLYSFFDVSVASTTGLLAQLNIMRDVVIFGSILYSLLVILTALVKYLYQSMNRGIYLKGQFWLGFYLTFLTANRITTAVSLFATTEPLKYDDGAQEPKIGIFTAFVLFNFLFGLRLLLVYVYKKYFSGRNISLKTIRSCSWQDERRIKVKRGWDSGNNVDKMINVIINCLVVTPFTVQTDPLQVLKRIQKDFGTEKTAEEKRDLQRRKSVIKSSDVESGSRPGSPPSEEDSIPLSLSFMSIPAQALSTDSLRTEIRNMWWDDPTTKLEYDAVKTKLKENGKCINMLVGSPQDQENRIRETMTNLERWSMINTPLLNPVKNKREYFWLFMIVVLENVIALFIEGYNGGVWTSQGHYYSWDVRLITFTLAILCLLYYYKNCHLTRDLLDPPKCGGWLNYLPICCCCVKDKPMKAMEDEDAMENVIGDHEKKQLMDMSTQTEEKWEKTEKRTVEVETQTDLNDIGGEGDKPSFKLSKTVSKLFQCTKTNSIESLHTTSPMKLDDLELSVRKPLLDQIDSKGDTDAEGVQNKVFEEEQSEVNQASSASNPNSVHQVEVKADFHHK